MLAKGMIVQDISGDVGVVIDLFPIWFEVGEDDGWPPELIRDTIIAAHFPESPENLYFFRRDGSHHLGDGDVLVKPHKGNGSAFSKSFLGLSEKELGPIVAEYFADLYQPRKEYDLTFRDKGTHVGLPPQEVVDKYKASGGVS